MKTLALSISIAIITVFAIACSNPGTDPVGDDDDDTIIDDENGGDGWTFDPPEGLYYEAEETQTEIGTMLYYAPVGTTNWRVENIGIGVDYGSGCSNQPWPGVADIVYRLSENADGSVSIDERLTTENFDPAREIRACGDLTGRNGLFVVFQIDMDRNSANEPLYMEAIERFRFVD